MDDAEREDAGGEGPVRHRGPWNEADYRALGDNADFGDGRVELVDGALLIGPGPTPDAERAIARTRAALDDALPDGLCVVGPVALRMGQDCVLVPDLVVMRAPTDRANEPAAETATDAETDAEAHAETEAATDAETDADTATTAIADTPEGAVVDAEEVLMVAEVVGAEHGAVDRVFKPLVYARARLPYLLVVDRAGALRGGEHGHQRPLPRVRPRGRGRTQLELEEPFRLRLPLPEK